MIKNNVVTKTAGTGTGWTGAALSLLGISGAGSAFFHADAASTGVVVGFNGAAEGAAFEAIDHGIRFATGVAYVVESGTDRHTIGGFYSSDEFEVRRVGQTITYYRNGALLYTSAVQSLGPVFLDVSLFAEGDNAFNPRLVLGEGGSYVEASAEAGFETVSGTGVGQTTITPLEVLALTISGRATGAATITAQELMSAAVRGLAVGAATFSVSEEGALSLSLVGVGRATVRPVGVDQETWAMNLETGGMTFYEGFSFNSYAKIGGRHFGCKADGIYQLDGDTDAGEPIRAMVSFGKQNFGTSALKRITNAYVGVSGQGRLFLKVLAEGREYTYAQRGYDEQLQVQRFDTGKGLRVNWLEFELYNADGEDFELASVEFAVVPLSRRI